MRGGGCPVPSSLPTGSARRGWASGPGWDPRGGQQPEAAAGGPDSGSAAGGGAELDGHRVPHGEGEEWEELVARVRGQWDGRTQGEEHTEPFPHAQPWEEQGPGRGLEALEHALKS